jgi:glycosyltransferase involved in cell wall biosynthesis
MKILFVCPRYHPNLTGWITALNNQGHEISMFVLRKDKIEDYSIVKPRILKISYFSRIIMYIFGGGTNFVNAYPPLINYFMDIRTLSPDLVIVRDPNRLLSIVTLIISKILSKKKIIYSQTPLYKYYSFKRKIITFFILKFFNAKWITPIKGKGLHKYPKKMFYLPFLSNFKITTKPLKDKIKSNIKILCVAKFGYPRKNIIMLLKSIIILKKKINISLTLIGDYPKKDKGLSKDFSNLYYLDQINKFIKKNNLDNSVSIFFDIPHSKMYKFYNESSLFVLPATNEPASISIVEALSMGLPVICSDNCGTKSYIDHGVNGYIFKDNSLLSLTKYLNLIISKSNYFQFLDNAHSYFEKNLTEEIFIQKFNNLIDDYKWK